MSNLEPAPVPTRMLTDAEVVEWRKEVDRIHTPRFFELYPELPPLFPLKERRCQKTIDRILADPSDDPRSDWVNICAYLAEQELFATGGLHMDRFCVIWDPTPEHQAILDAFVDKHFRNWSVCPDDRSFVEGDALCILVQAKHALLTSEEDLLRNHKKTEPLENQRPAPYKRIDEVLGKITLPPDTLTLDAKIRKLVQSHRLQDDIPATNYLVGKIAEHQHIFLGKRDAGVLVKGIVKDVRKAERPQPNSETVPDVTVCSDHFMSNWSQEKLANACDQNGDPLMYQFEGEVADIHNGQRRMLTEAAYAARLNSATRWKTTTRDKERGVFAPKDVVSYNYNRSDKSYAELKEVKTSPFFARDGRRIDQPGYDEATSTYLNTDIEVRRVSDVPSADEVQSAKLLMLGEMLGDFPFDGVTERAERLERALYNTESSAPLPSAAHAMCMALERACRDMIDGPTPVYTSTKPLPGTGAGRLTAAVTLAATGRKAAAEPMPASEEEYTKVMGAHISQSEEFVFFDNMNTALTFGTFASNVSEGRVRTRLLGSSRMIEASVRHTWVAAANNVKGSSEILRRMVMIELDAKTPRPDKRTDFRHTDLEQWISQNREELVWAILTLIQNWVAKGMRPWEGNPKASFEAWSRVMGGILRDAGIRGFLENEDRLRSYGSTTGDSGLDIFVQHLAVTHSSGTLFRAGGTSEIRGRKGERVFSIQEELNLADDGNPLLLDGWGYSREDNRYNHARGINPQFREAARRAFEVVLHEGDETVRYAIAFSEFPDPQSPKQLFWEMTKTKIED